MIYNYIIIMNVWCIKNYKIYRTDRPNRVGGGTAILIKSHISHDPIAPPQSDNLEITSLKINLLDGDLILHSIYKPPNLPISAEDIARVYDYNLLTIAAGDFNCKHGRWGCRGTNNSGRSLLTQIIDQNLTRHTPQNPPIITIPLPTSLISQFPKTSPITSS